MAIEIGCERGLLERDKQGKLKKKLKNGLSAEDIISSVIEENINISGGYKKESIYDTLLWQIITFPLILFNHLKWWMRWIKLYWIQKQEYDDNAKHYLIQKNLKISEDQFSVLNLFYLKIFFYLRH